MQSTNPLRLAFGVLSPVLLCLFAASCATDEPEPQVLRHAMSAIEGGQTDRENTSVMGIFSQSSGGACTGTLLAPNLLLTAQHCVAEVPTAFVICDRTQFGDVYPASGFVSTTNGDSP